MQWTTSVFTDRLLGIDVTSCIWRVYIDKNLFLLLSVDILLFSISLDTKKKRLRERKDLQKERKNWREKHTYRTYSFASDWSTCFPLLLSYPILSKSPPNPHITSTPLTPLSTPRFNPRCPPPQPQAPSPPPPSPPPRRAKTSKSAKPTRRKTTPRTPPNPSNCPPRDNPSSTT